MCCWTAVTALKKSLAADADRDGPERERLESVVMERGLVGRVRFAGSCTHADLPR